jgi:hypothetical protein
MIIVARQLHRRPSVPRESGSEVQPVYSVFEIPIDLVEEW